VTGALREIDARLELPFDQFQRYSVAAELLRSLQVPRGERVLEVGGAPGALEAFMPEYTLVVSDIEGLGEGRFLLADGTSLPFPDDSFAVVIALDVLEHVPAAARPAFLSEARRVSSDLVVLSAPFADPDLELAEEALNEFIRARFGGDFPTLDEHALNTLPELAATIERVAGDDRATATLPSGYLPHWLAGMLVHHELLATGVPYLGKLHAYYNQVISPLDCREPSYRHVVIGSAKRSSGELTSVTDAMLTPGGSAQGSAALAAMASSVLAQRLGGVARFEERHDELRQAEDAIKLLEREVADRDAHVIELERLVGDLRNERDQAIAGERVAASKAWLLGVPYIVRRVRGRLAAKG
jgi:SAM-dependent methyltransferase